MSFSTIAIDGGDRKEFIEEHFFEKRINPSIKSVIFD
jgi:hypothetical protein